MWVAVGHALSLLCTKAWEVGARKNATHSDLRIILRQPGTSERKLYGQEVKHVVPFIPTSWIVWRSSFYEQANVKTWTKCKRSDFCIKLIILLKERRGKKNKHCSEEQVGKKKPCPKGCLDFLSKSLLFIYLRPNLTFCHQTMHYSRMKSFLGGESCLLAGVDVSTEWTQNSLSSRHRKWLTPLRSPQASLLIAQTEQGSIEEMCVQPVQSAGQQDSSCPVVRVFEKPPSFSPDWGAKLPAKKLGNCVELLSPYCVCSPYSCTLLCACCSSLQAKKKEGEKKKEKKYSC